MSEVLPVGIVVPVKQCRPALDAHIADLLELLPHVEQVVVVDSASTDGTMEALQAALQHPGAEFHDRPPGLYQAWNFGISQVTSRYVYMATVGDCIGLKGLQQLVQTAESLQVDAVISPPELVNDSGQALGKTWPVHELVRERKLEAPVVLPVREWLGRCLAAYPATLIGSSASNLYRADFLQAHPLPVEYGHAGDAAWAVKMSFQARWAVDPTVPSKFWIHETQPGVVGIRGDLVERLLGAPEELAAEAEGRWAEDPVLPRIMAAYRQLQPRMVSRMHGMAAYRERCASSPWAQFLPSVRRWRRHLRKEKREIEALQESMQSLLTEYPMDGERG
ncbi:glycosyltransferase involved in cell wall biosynthesis [Haloferula luteola]|uniref:Glycosyltransferase involved in cell wall biosynthesis n=1 Tax=Haloferula luteola TaxID=595692 RepID=A0A840V4Y5_9BACT|nr:glycosyltransferase family A protein [Haloferula luteola]MBB5352643.1 glycosyltransferase involved in cell wall biosynthesis [Haloferula luteola]